jgi:hypothetical protein
MRYEKFWIKVEKNIKADLEEIAQSYGLYTSTLIAFIVGQWVVNEKNKKEKGSLPVPAENHAPGVQV